MSQAELVYRFKLRVSVDLIRSERRAFCIGLIDFGLVKHSSFDWMWTVGCDTYFTNHTSLMLKYKKKSVITAPTPLNLLYVVWDRPQILYRTTQTHNFQTRTHDGLHEISIIIPIVHLQNLWTLVRFFQLTLPSSPTNQPYIITISLSLSDSVQYKILSLSNFSPLICRGRI